MALLTRCNNLYLLYKPQHGLDLTEVGSSGRFVLPARAHQVVNRRRAARWKYKALPSLYSTNDVIVLDALERLYSVHKDLPHANTCQESERLLLCLAKIL